MPRRIDMAAQPTAQGAAGGPPETEDERSEGVGVGGPPAAGPDAPKIASNTEVVAKPRRRQFSATYKRRILGEADRCTESGDIGRLLRREGLYGSHLTDWRRAREAGVLDALAPKKRGRKASEREPMATRVMELERQNTALQESLRKANLIISVQKKVAALFDEIDSNERDS